MKHIPNEIKKEFLYGNFVVQGSKQSFSQVDPDHAQEWLNRTGKTSGGIIGITKTISALMKWTLTFNARSFIANQTYEMFGLIMDNLVTKETTNSRKSRDNIDENMLLATLMSFNVFMDTPDSLINIATKDVASADIQESLLEAEDTGESRMEEFVKRIIDGTKSTAVMLVATLKHFNVLLDSSDFLTSIAPIDIASLLEDRGESCMVEFVKRIIKRTESIEATEFYRNLERTNSKKLRIFT